MIIVIAAAISIKVLYVEYLNQVFNAWLPSLILTVYNLFSHLFKLFDLTRVHVIVLQDKILSYHLLCQA